MPFRLIYIFSFIFLLLSILNPIHTLPWVGFFSEFSCYIAGWLLTLSLCFFKNKIPVDIIPFVIILLVPLMQYIFGEIFFFSNFFFSTISLFYFLLMLIVGFNSKIRNFNIIMYLAVFFIISGLFSSLIAIIQWVGLSENKLFIMGLVGNRPYGNMAQPNHLATFLCVSLLSLWYLFEKYKINQFTLSFFSIFISTSILLTQSRTAWIILLLFLMFLSIGIKKYNLRLSMKNIGFLSIFIIFFCISLPYFNLILSSNFNIINTVGLIDRATTGYQRLEIWNQMIHAITEEPWHGYGWNQTTAAQFRVIDSIHNKEWVTSAHNLILDIFVWCGIPLGLLIVSYFVYLYIKIIFSISDLESIFCFLAISSILIHSLLEFPLYYSYFFIPFSLFLGYALGYKYKVCLKINSLFILFFLIFNFFLGVVVFKEYLKINDNLFSGKLHAMGNQRDKVKLPYKLVFFDFFDERAKWLALYPKMKVDREEILLGNKMVQTYLKPYDIYKYAQLLAFNGCKEESIRQLKILSILYDIHVSYEDLLRKDNSLISN